MPGIRDHLERLREELARLEAELSRPEAAQDAAFARRSQRYAQLREIVALDEQLAELEWRLAQARDLAQEDDPELRELALEEQKALSAERETLEVRLLEHLLPPEPEDAQNAVLEIRAGTGGEEAALFAAELARMYLKYAERRGWRAELLEVSPSELGGFKEAVFLVQGRGAYGRLKFESGVHRVQRVPATESSGRIHTSTVTVAVLPETEEVEIEIRPEELKIEVFRAGGPGGQSVNTTDSAVRITHLPTGLVATCQDEKSQHKNKAKALRVLRARLQERAQRARHAELDRRRRVQIGTAARSEKVRTYNFPQNRVTDHRIELTLHRLEAVLREGELDLLIEPLARAYREERLSELVQGG